MERLERIETQVSSQEDSIASVRRLRRLAHVDVGSGRHTCTSFGQRRPCSIDGIEGDAAALPRSLGEGRKPDQDRMKELHVDGKGGTVLPMLLRISEQQEHFRPPQTCTRPVRLLLTSQLVTANRGGFCCFTEHLILSWLRHDRPAVVYVETRPLGLRLPSTSSLCEMTYRISSCIFKTRRPVHRISDLPHGRHTSNVPDVFARSDRCLAPPLRIRVDGARSGISCFPGSSSSPS